MIFSFYIAFLAMRYNISSYIFEWEGGGVDLAIYRK